MRWQGLNLRYLGVWLVLCTIWSSTWLFIKVGLNDHLPPIWFAGLRFVLASAVLGLFNLWRRAPWPRAASDWVLIAWTGFLTFSVNYGLLFWGEKRITSGLCAVLQATIPAFGLLFAHLYIPGERLTAPKIGGVALGLLGVGIIFSDELHLAGTSALWGSAAIVVGAASTSYASVLIKARGKHLDPAVLSAGQMLCGWVPLVALGACLEGAPWRFHWNGSAVFSLFYLALLGSSLAFCLMYWLVRRVEITKIMLISLVTPVTAVLLGALVLDETLSSHAMLGGLCVMLGLGLVIYRRAPQTPVPAAEVLDNVEG